MADRHRSNSANPAPGRSQPPANGMRRNFFQPNLTRRPTATSSNSAETLRLDVDVLSDDTEIVVRNQHGLFELGDPPTSILEDPDEMPTDDQKDSAKERQMLAEAVKHHQINHSAVRDQPEELLEAVRASLKAKVSALSDDNWMFETEEQGRSQS